MFKLTIVAKDQFGFITRMKRDVELKNIPTAIAHITDKIAANEQMELYEINVRVLKVRKPRKSGVK
jgi:hypothetical protein